MNMEGVGANCRSVFEGSNITYPARRVTHEDNGDSKMGSYALPYTRSLLNTLMPSLPPSMAGPRLPSSSNFRPSSGPLVNVTAAGGKRTKLR